MSHGLVLLHPSHLSGIHVFTRFSFYYQAALFYLISASSTSASACGSDGSVLLYQTLNYKRNLGQIQGFASACPACAHSEEAEALPLIKRWVWEQEQNF